MSHVAAAEPGSPWFRTLSERALHLYGPPTEQGSLDQGDHAPYQLYPSLNFTCTGTVLKLYFVASQTGHDGSIMSPEFYLVGPMANCHGSANTCSEYRLLRLNERTQQPGTIYSNNGVGLYEIPISVSSKMFNSASGDMLGVCYPRLTSNNSILTILYQSGGGYYDTLDCKSTNINECTYTQEPILPYIAIETQSTAGQFTCIII